MGWGFRMKRSLRRNETKTLIISKTFFSWKPFPVSIQIPLFLASTMKSERCLKQKFNSNCTFRTLFRSLKMYSQKRSALSWTWKNTQIQMVWVSRETWHWQHLYLGRSPQKQRLLQLSLLVLRPRTLLLALWFQTLSSLWSWLAH